MSPFSNFADAGRRPVGKPLRRPLRRLDRRLNGIGLLLILLLVWECSARCGWVASSYWPPVSAVFSAAIRGLASEEIWLMLGGTLRRMIIGYVIGCCIGVTCGLLLAANRWLRYILQPLIEIIRPVPAPAIIPPLILFLGVDDALKIFIVALASFFPAFTNALAGALGIDDVLLATGRTFRIGPWRMLTQLILPAALPSIAAGLRTAISLALVVTVIAEMIAGSDGIGYHIVQMQYAVRPDAMYAAILYLAALGYCLNRIFLQIEARLIPWMGKS